jgi:hypothetical protein
MSDLNGRTPYEWIQELKQQTGARSVRDLVALSLKNDPFYSGQGYHRRDAPWFAEVWKQAGGRMHLRGFHYVLQSSGDVKLPRPVVWTDKATGKMRKTRIYLNNRACWDYLLAAARPARNLGLVDYEDVLDERTPPAEVFHMRYTPGGQFGVIHAPGLFDIQAQVDLPGILAGGLDETNDGRAYLLEVWCEKSSPLDELRQVCRDRGANLIWAPGYMVYGATLALLKRAAEARRPCRVWYVSDFDKNGRIMPIAVGRFLEYMIRFGPYEDYRGLDIRVKSLALTREQAAKYPPAPDSDEFKVELDAMLALDPGLLRRLAQDALDEYDVEVGDWISDRHSDLEDDLEAAFDELAAAQDPTLQGDTAAFEQQAEDFAEQIDAQAAELREQHQEIAQRVETILEAVYEKVKPSEYLKGLDEELDAARIEEAADWLFDSQRDYLDQMAFYKAASPAEDDTPPPAA